MKIEQRIKKILPFVTKKSIDDILLHPSNRALVCRINNDFIIKIPLNAESGADIEKEIKIASILKQHDLSTATPNWERIDLPIDLEQNKYNPPFCAVSAVLKGNTPTVIDTPKLAQDLGQFLSGLHNIKTNLFEPILSSIEHMFNLELRMFDLLGYRINSTTKEYLKNTVFSPTNEVFQNSIQPVLCHHDLHLGNLLVDKNGRLSGVLDFGCARIANRSCDLKLISSYQSSKVQKIFLDTYKQNTNKEIDLNTANTQENNLLLKMKTNLAIALQQCQNQHS